MTKKTTTVSNSIIICEKCEGTGKETEHAGQGFIIETGKNCEVCEGKGRVRRINNVIIETI